MTKPNFRNLVYVTISENNIDTVFENQSNVDIVFSHIVLSLGGKSRLIKFANI